MVNNLFKLSAATPTYAMDLMEDLQQQRMNIYMKMTQIWTTIVQVDDKDRTQLPRLIKKAL